MEEAILARVVAVEERSKSNTHRLDRLEGMTAAINDQCVAIRELVTELRHTNEHIKDHESRLDELEAQPAQSWSRLKTTIVTAIASSLVTAAVAALIALMAAAS